MRRALRHDMLAAIIAGVQLFDEKGGIRGWYRGAHAELARDHKLLPIYSNVEVASFESNPKSCVFQVWLLHCSPTLSVTLAKLQEPRKKCASYLLTLLFDSLTRPFVVVKLVLESGARTFGSSICLFRL